MSPERRRIPDYLLERAAAGDLRPEEHAALLDALSREPGGQERLTALARDDTDALARLPPGAVADRVKARAAPRKGPIGWLLAPAATAALALVFATTWRPEAAPMETPDVTRVKGLEPHLVIHQDMPNGPSLLQSGASARPGDSLQLGYVAGGRRFGAIVSIDGRGVATLHFPTSGSVAGRLAPQREALLSQSFRLDDAPGFERFLLVTGDAPFPVDEVLRAARTLAGHPDARHAPLPVGGHLSVSSTLILKEVR